MAESNDTRSSFPVDVCEFVWDSLLLEGISYGVMLIGWKQWDTHVILFLLLLSISLSIVTMAIYIYPFFFLLLLLFFRSLPFFFIFCFLYNRRYSSKLSIVIEHSIFLFSFHFFWHLDFYWRQIKSLFVFYGKTLSSYYYRRWNSRSFVCKIFAWK